MPTRFGFCHSIRKRKSDFPDFRCSFQDFNRGECEVAHRGHRRNVGPQVAFAVWSPLLLLISSAVCPIFLLTMDIIFELKKRQLALPPMEIADEANNCNLEEYFGFASQLVSHLKVPYPRKLVSRIILTSLEFAILAALFDYGAPLTSAAIDAVYLLLLCRFWNRSICCLCTSYCCQPRNSSLVCLRVQQAAPTRKIPK